MCAVRPTLQRVQLWNKAVAKVLIKIMKDFVSQNKQPRELVCLCLVPLAITFSDIKMNQLFLPFHFQRRLSACWQAGRAVFESQ